VCISWNIFNRIHFFAICDVFLFAIRSFFIYDISIYMIISKVDEAASTNLFFFIIYNSYHIANQLYQYSCISRTIASSQHHPRETRPLLSQPNLYKIFYIGIAYDKFALYITRNESTLFASSISSIHLFFFSFLHFHITYEVLKSIYMLIFFSFLYINIIYIKLKSTIYFLLLFLLFIYWYYIWSWSQSICFFYFFYSSIFFSFLHFHITYEVLKSIYMLIFFSFLYINIIYIKL